METQARYAIVGLFTLIVVAAGFVFVYWLHGFSSGGALAVYRIRFDAPVIGLRPGAAVLFNGLRVGEVTSVRFDPAAPKILMTRIAIDMTTPVRADTLVGIDSQGLTGSATISLTGGASTEPLRPDANGEPPLLVAPARETGSLTREAKRALMRLDDILSDNAAPLRGIINDIGTFSAALSRNSGRVDSILAGLEKMSGGGPPKPAPISYNLTAPDFADRADLPAKARGAQIALPEPTALVAYQTQKVLAAPKPDQLQPLEEGQWADSLPKLVQARMLESLEKAGFAHAGKAADGFTPTVQLVIEIRSFQVTLTEPRAARIELSAKWLGADAKILSERTFSGASPLGGGDGASAAAALNAAFQIVARAMVGWSASTIPEIVDVGGGTGQTATPPKPSDQKR